MTLVVVRAEIDGRDHLVRMRSLPRTPPAPGASSSGTSTTKRIAPLMSVAASAAGIRGRLVHAR